MYNPEDTVANDWWRSYETRKNRLSYKIWPDSDDFIISWDAIKEEHISVFEAMMYDRKNRYDNKYLWTMPFLNRLIEAKREEIAAEKEFKELMIHKSGRSEEKVKAAIDWWKLKNKWKRSLRSDDNKAFRMIMRRLNR
jgi:hypothetical protein